MTYPLVLMGQTSPQTRTPQSAPHIERRYCGNYIYSGPALSQILIDGGYITLDSSGNPSYYFYVQDHQGNNRLVLSASGGVEEVNSYYPYGGLMSMSTASTQRFKYNGKELNQHSYMMWYDYGARQSAPLLGRFTSMDPLCENYYPISPYAYCVGNSVRFVDPDGGKVVFVNGYLGFGSTKGGSVYWNGAHSAFVKAAQSAFKDYATPFFTNYDYDYMASANYVREILGYRYAKENYQTLIEGMEPGEDKFNFVSHSMGGAFSEGMMKYLSEQGWETDNAVFLNAWEPTEINTKIENTRIDVTCTFDPVQILSIPIFGNPDIPSSDAKIRIKSGESFWYIHKDLINANRKDLWKQINVFFSE